MKTDEFLAFVDKCLLADKSQRYELAGELVSLCGRYALEAINQTFAQMHKDMQF